MNLSACAKYAMLLTIHVKISSLISRVNNTEEKLFGIAARDCDGNPKYFCTVCNYPAYDEFNLSLHNDSKDHKQKLADKEPPPQAEDCEREQEEKSTSGSL
ncbi:uncharacterized protein LOC130496497 [Raphanus sativus]|uniref:Uncharacterized protein LOC130496497 n=1 Tax=Raphanus sativus TaxID=3726 RepID=A0A9W3BZD1_RAPSA|nr:uncharacterized protein LOC130496497 [Raphanus sativus]